MAEHYTESHVVMAECVREVCRNPDGGVIPKRWRLDDIASTGSFLRQYMAPSEYRRVAFMIGAEKVGDGLTTSRARAASSDSTWQLQRIVDRSEEGVEWVG